MGLSASEDLPDFEEEKVYLVTGATLKLFEDALKENRPRVTEGGGLKIDLEGPDGVYLSVK